MCLLKRKQPKQDPADFLHPYCRLLRHSLPANKCLLLLLIWKFRPGEMVTPASQRIRLHLPGLLLGSLGIRFPDAHPATLSTEKLTKTIAIGCVRFINDEVHVDSMEIRDAVEDKEHSYTDDSEEIVCPVCGTTWLTDIDGDATFDSCEHLRFSLHSECDDDFEFYGEWDLEDFLKLVEEAREKDDDIHILDILSQIQHPEVDKAMIYVWQEDPLNHPWMIWGYKEN
jgi:hypothetical protein